MKRVIGITLVLICLTCSAMAESRISPFLSWASNNGMSALGGGLQYEFMINANFGIAGRAAYLTASGDSIMPLTLGLTGVLPLKGISLYAAVGGGYFIPNTEDPNDKPDAAFGFYLGGGIRVPIAKAIDFFAEIAYLNAKSEKTITESGSGPGYYWEYTRTISMDVSGPAINLGITFKL